MIGRVVKTLFFFRTATWGVRDPCLTTSGTQSLGRKGCRKCLVNPLGCKTQPPGVETNADNQEERQKGCDLRAD